MPFPNKSFDQWTREEKQAAFDHWMEAIRKRKYESSEARRKRYHSLKAVAERAYKKSLDRQGGYRLSGEGLEILRTRLVKGLEYSKFQLSESDMGLLDKIGNLVEKGPSSDGYYYLPLTPKEKRRLSDWAGTEAIHDAAETKYLGQGI